MTRHPDCDSQPLEVAIDRTVCRERVRRQCGECLACEVGRTIREEECAKLRTKLVPEVEAQQ